MPIKFPPIRQQGAGLLLLLMPLSLLAALSLLQWPQPEAQLAARAAATATSLARAREALLAWALLYPEQHQDMPPGYLPCPDQNGDGNAEPVCGRKGENRLGRLPWRTLGLPPLRDGAGECLWYAVSGSYKNNPKLALSSDSDGKLVLQDRQRRTVVGGRARERALAVIIAPGVALPGQRRGARGHNAVCGAADVAAYLESANGFGGDKSTTLSAQVPATAIDAQFNDVLLALTPADFQPVYRRMDRWVANRVAVCLERYGRANGHKLPWMVPVQVNTDYHDRKGVRAGRIANAVAGGDPEQLPGLASTTATDPQMTASWEPWPGAADCFYEAGHRAEQWWWWRAWKDMVFVVTDPARVPASEAASRLRLRLHDRRHDAIVLVAGRRLPAQQRPSARLAEYLEGGNARLQALHFNDATASANDVLLGVSLVTPDESQ